ncbi:MAG: sn-glycerol-3-phosphate ABC transporter ATP-binding protein UgpC [Azospirillaceae bacterium]|nr:sn-glycerol-3-phosphate ABC transporter ATP-binding protein UgpC [Azospirillaceae bacterium]
MTSAARAASRGATTPASGVVLDRVTKRFGAVDVLRDISLTIADGEFIVFVGPSGCGKSTLLRMIAGLEEVSDGTIAIGGRDVTDAEPSERGIAMVFQTYALYPHLSVRDNMGFSLKMAGRPRAEVAAKVEAAAELLHLIALLDRRPAQLSGGQRQRVAIGRAIVRDPRVFLFDEPLSNLDAELRIEMRIEIAKLHRRLGNTMIYVTHDQTEAMTLADRIVVLRGGRIEQAGKPADIFGDPDNLFVAGFIGSPKINVLPGRFTTEGLEIDGSLLTGPDCIAGQRCDGAVSVAIRPHLLHLVGDSDPGIPVKIDFAEYLGDKTYVHGQSRSDHAVVTEIASGPPPAPGSIIRLGSRPEDVLLFDGGGSRLR